ncbi:hypothetical protein BC939DRAFT_473913 [Gamsiella multidivaricata]|uniref:uncharacterized protein n=1 Tax=Gamsiella multidivaricata TaxID=101098 RepID=UPI002220F75E|nr:uncharacterized protein BC939DRAFT_473913 [Gamsiella multidivaricata]KAI7829702.1 hypothetical protein BC939DRAFT_473913 [Gamsiella multidivaricata]
MVLSTIPNLTPFCLTDGEPTSNAFPVSIPSTDTISNLRNLIKAEKAVAFADVAADKLTVWRVSVPVVAVNIHNAVFLNEIDSKTELSPATRLFKIFTEEPSEEAIHITVQRLLPVNGSGKTCTAMELLSNTWGLYFNGGAKDWGSSGMNTLINALSDYKTIYLTQSRDGNTDRLRHLTYGLLYARLLILDYCLVQPESKINFLCQRWMLLQVATPAFMDVFQSLFKDINVYLHRHPISGFILNAVQELFDKVQKQLLDRTTSFDAAPFKFLVVLDEAQVLDRLFNGLYLDSNGTTPRPVLTPVLRAFRHITNTIDEHKVCVMPCGASLSNLDVDWSGGAGSGDKLSKGDFEAGASLDMIADFAGWTSEDSVACYVKRLGDTLSEDARMRLTHLFPREVIQNLYRDFTGRVRHMISVVV